MKEAAHLIRRNGGTSRHIQLFANGVRRVTLDFYGESWHSYTIIPRSLMIAGIRHRRSQGAQYHDCDWWTLVDGLDRWIAPEGYGGPGRPFAREPHRIYGSRRYVVICQSGGLDI